MVAILDDGDGDDGDDGDDDNGDDGDGDDGDGDDDIAMQSCCPAERSHDALRAGL